MSMETKVRAIYKDNFAEYLLCLALDVGEGMLRNGGEIGRVEDTVERICYAYGAAHVEVFTIISVIHASIRMQDGSGSEQMRRVKSTSMNLSTLERLNALSRKICETTPPLDDFEEQYHEAKNCKTYPWWLIMLSWSIVAASFAVFFDGTYRDALVAALAGVVMYFIDAYAPRRMNGIGTSVLSSLVASLIAGISILLGIGTDGGIIIIGSIMLLVPGISIGVAMRDIFCGDTLAGMLKLLQACLCALMIAFGYFIAVSLVGGGVI